MYLATRPSGRSEPETKGPDTQTRRSPLRRRDARRRFHCLSPSIRPSSLTSSPTAAVRNRDELQGLGLSHPGWRPSPARPISAVRGGRSITPDRVAARIDQAGPRCRGTIGTPRPRGIRPGASRRPPSFPAHTDGCRGPAQPSRTPRRPPARRRRRHRRGGAGSRASVPPRQLGRQQPGVALARVGLSMIAAPRPLGRRTSKATSPTRMRRLQPSSYQAGHLDNDFRMKPAGTSERERARNSRPRFSTADITACTAEARARGKCSYADA